MNPCGCINKEKENETSSTLIEGILAFFQIYAVRNDT